MPPKDVERMANSVDPDQTAPLEQSDQNLHCLLRHTCPNIENFYGSCIFESSQGKSYVLIITLHTQQS